MRNFLNLGMTRFDEISPFWWPVVAVTKGGEGQRLLTTFYGRYLPTVLPTAAREHRCCFSDKRREERQLHKDYASLFLPACRFRTSKSAHWQVGTSVGDGLLTKCAKAGTTKLFTVRQKETSSTQGGDRSASS